MKQRLLVPVHLRHDVGHILQVALGGDGLLQVIGIAALQPVFIRRVRYDFSFLHRRNVTGIDVQGDAALFAQAPKDGLFLRGGLILSQGPDTPESVPANKIIR